MLVPDLVDEGEALLPQRLGALEVAGDGGRSAVAAEGIRSGLGRDGLCLGMLEQPLEPADSFARVVIRPEHVCRRRQLEPERDLTALESPGEGPADVVLLGDRDVEAHRLARIKLGGGEVRVLQHSEEEVGVPPPLVLGLGRLV